jgi:hypothetical protein
MGCPTSLLEPAFEGMKTEIDEVPEHEAVVAFRKNVAWLVRDEVITPHCATEILRAFQNAIKNGRTNRLAVIAVVDALLHALDHGLLAKELFELDPKRQVVRFQLAPTLVELVARGLLKRQVWERLRRLMKTAEGWLPAAGISAVQRRFSFGGQQHRGFELDLAKARAFLKRTEAVPFR